MQPFKQQIYLLLLFLIFISVLNMVKGHLNVPTCLKVNTPTMNSPSLCSSNNYHHYQQVHRLVNMLFHLRVLMYDKNKLTSYRKCRQLVQPCA